MKRVIGIKTVATILCFEDFNRLCLISKNKIIIEKQNEIWTSVGLFNDNNKVPSTIIIVIVIYFERFFVSVYAGKMEAVNE